MRIVIDGRLYSESGVGRYIRNLIFNLGEIDQSNEYIVLLLKKNLEQKLPANFEKVEADIAWYSLSEQIKLPKILNSLKPDLVHFPHFNVPIFYSGKYVVTIHDLIHLHHKMRRASTLNPLIYQIKHISYKKVFSNALKKSEKILTPSNFVKEQLIKEWDVSGEKVNVTYEGVDNEIINLSKKINKEKSKNVLEKFKIKSPFIFYVGNAHPHKNVEGLIETFLKLRQNYQYLQLVLSGHDHYFWKRIKENYKNANIIYTGFISDEELVALYKESKAFVMPSFEEGFGIPLLEGMACETAVVSSNAGSLKEVGGDAALYFDPKNIDEMVEKISDVLNSEKLRKELIEKGKKRVKDFSWEKLAKETLEVYKST